MAGGEKRIVTRDGFADLLAALSGEGYRVIGPTVRDGVIAYDDLDSIADLPAGWMDVQDGGHYRLTRRDDAMLFGFAVGPQSWKKYLHPPHQRLWSARLDEDGIRIEPEPLSGERLAFIGVRACELHAIAVQDRVLAAPPHADPHYSARRQNTFIVAVNCASAAGTCFCASMGTGPEVTAGFDIALTELADDDGHRFVAEAASPDGERLLAAVSVGPAGDAEVAGAAAIVARTAAEMGREMPALDLHDLLLSNPDHPAWDDVAARCLTCGNCTMVCPTCFCTTTEDTSDISGRESARAQRWDSCFTMDFSYLHGGSVRTSAKSRYRQWMTHKLATWIDQFGTSGCVGCGRCITWCPVGIDITAEVAAIADGQGGH